MPQTRINAARLNQSLEELGRFGDTPEGMQRIAFSPADIQGREYTISLMRRAGMEIRIDTAGNIIGRRAGSVPGLPAIAMGSHTDTVPAGGKYDGALGVMGAVECVQSLADNNITLRHPVEALVFTNEEGTSFHRWLIGSRAMAGLLEPDDQNPVADNNITLRHPVEALVFTNEEGTSFHRWLIGSRAMAGLLEPDDQNPVADDGADLNTRMADIGGDWPRRAEAVRRRQDLGAYFELHIEQGPTLHQTGTPIGVVTGITGRAMFEVEIIGTANHAGTTPMTHRNDALVSASKLVLAVNRLASELETCRVATVGSIEVNPNAVNVVPGSAKIGLEFRDLSMDALTATEAELRNAADQISQEDGVRMEIYRHRFTNSVPIEIEMQDLVETASNNAGFANIRLPSGAGHDAQAIASITKIAMVFVPSTDGISHAPQEYSTPEDCANGTQVLLELLMLADERL
jgi:N-carbamoyl-L-amino-acid hydrolase